MSIRKKRARHHLATLGLVTVAALSAPLMSHAATTGTITGTIKSADGTPLKGVNVTLEGSGLTTVTDKNGYYIFTGVTPSTYTVKADIVTFKTTETPVTVTADVSSPVDFSLEKATIQTGTSRITGSAGIRGTETNTQYSIGAPMEQKTKSQPNNLYQFPGLVFGQPGITPDPSGYTHIRGSDYNQVGFQVDGINITSPFDNGFATNIVTVGLRSANLITGGADASYGGSTGGFINELTINGKDMRGGFIEGTFGPGYGWKYTGTNTQYGNVTSDGKFDYALSTIAFKNKFPGNTQIQSLNSSIDGLLKTNYYMDPKNTLTVFYGHGFEQYDSFQDPNDLSTQAQIKYETGQNTARVTGQYQQDHSDQGYDMSYVTLKHNFDSKSFFTDRIYRLYNFVTFHAEPLSANFQHINGTQTGNQLDYSNSISPNYRITAGFHYLPSTAGFRNITGITGDQTDPSFPARGYTDRINITHAAQTVLYLSNEIKPANSKTTITAGLRYANQKISNLRLENIIDPATGKPYGVGSYSNSYTDPRLGVVYAATKDFAVRANFTKNSQFPDTRRVQTLFPEDVTDLGYVPTAQDPAAQLKRLANRYARFNRLGVSQSQDLDIGFDKGFSIRNEPYSLSATIFRRQQHGLLQLNYTDFTAIAQAFGTLYPLYYTNDGTGHASGLELILNKRGRKQTDWNGFLSYTNQVAKANNSLFDTGYLPYFATYVTDLGLTNAQYIQNNKKEFATSYDQRHTVALVANKRINKLIDTSFIMDAGSGFPFAGGAPITGNNVAFGADSQHADIQEGDAEFSEVPVTLLNQQSIQPVNPVVGRSGWHYKFSLNTNFHLTDDNSIFLNVDNIFDKKTVVNYATVTQSGVPYYLPPSPEYPQGRSYYGPSTIITPIFLTVGFRHKF